MPLSDMRQFPEMEAGARKIADVIKPMIPAGIGFTLFLYEMQNRPGGGLAWISTGDRTDMILTLIEFIDHDLDLPAGEKLIDHVFQTLPEAKRQAQMHQPPFQRQRKLQWFRDHIGTGGGLSPADAAALLALAEGGP